MINFILVAYLAMTIIYFALVLIGLNLYRKIFSIKKTSIKQFFVVEIIIFISFAGLIHILRFWDNSPVKSIIDTINYFELGSFSLLIATLPITAIIEKKDRELKRAIFLSLLSTIIFFTIGTLLALTNILQTNNPLSDTIRQEFFNLFNAGLFLGIYNLLHSAVFLLEHYLKNIGFD